MDNLTLLIPAKEESESLPLVLDELKKYNYKSNIIIYADVSIGYNHGNNRS